MLSLASRAPAYRVAIIFSATACLVAGPTAARVPSATATGNMPLAQVEDDSVASKQVNAFYYTQLVVDASGFNIPQSDSERKKLGRALLETLNLKKETKSVIVSLSISAEGIAYPEIPILAYQFDGSRKLTNVVLAQRKTLSLQRLPASGHYDVTLRYRYSDQNQFDVRRAADAIAGLVPASTLANVVTKPFFAGLGTLVSEMFTLSGSSDTSFSISDEMSPFTGGNNRLVATLRRPDQTEFGKVTLSLAATPLIGRTAKTDLSTLSDTDFKKGPLEDASSFSMTIGGTRRSLLSEVKAIPEYSRLASDKSAQALSSYCTSAMSKLDQELNLTPMERVLVVHQSLLDARFDLGQGNWYFACYNLTDLNWLKMAIDANPVRITDVGPISGLAVASPIKYALGCLLTNQAGDDCSSRAPDPKALLLSTFDAKVEIGQMELPNVIDVTTLSADRKVDRDVLVEALRGKAGRFGCFPQGLLLQSAQGAPTYQVRAALSEGRIVRLDVVSVPTATFACTG